MGNIKVTQQTQVIVNQTTVIEQSAPQPAPKPVEPAPQPLVKQDTFKPSTPDSPIGVLKKTAGGALLGGGISTVAAMAGHAMVENRFQPPTFTNIGLGVALGTGIGLINLDTGNKEINAATKTLGGTLMGVGITGMAQSVTKSFFTESLQGPSGSGLFLGAALGGGIALANVETGNHAIDVGAKAASGVLLGASITGMAQGVAKSLFTSYLHAPSASGVLLGAALGGGIALANLETEDKAVKAVKNTAAGALIGGGAVGLASALVKTLGSEALAGYSPIAMGIGAALGAGIAILNAED